MQQVHCLGCNWTEHGHMFLHQGANVLIKSIDIVISEPCLWNISNIEVSAQSIVTTPTRNLGTCTSNTPCICELQVNEILTTQMQLVMLPTVLLKNEVELDKVPFTVLNLWNDPIQLTKHAPVGSLQLCTDYHENQNINWPGNRPSCCWKRWNIALHSTWC